MSAESLPVEYRIEGPGRCDIEIRWNAQARAFFVDYGNVHFSVTRLGAILLGDALREAVRIHGRLARL
jgi:hypothetical protein